MMRQYTKLLPLFVILMMPACSEKKTKADDPIGGSGRTVRTENLLKNLIAQGDSGVYMFGHHDDTMYGLGWRADYENDSIVGTRSDVQSVCGDLPSVMSFDLGRIELEDENNLDRVRFDRIRKEILRQFERGGMTTLSWHVNNPLSGGNSWIRDSRLCSKEAQYMRNIWAGLTR